MSAHAQVDEDQSISRPRLGKETAPSPKAPDGHATNDRAKIKNDAPQTESNDDKQHLEDESHNKREGQKQSDKDIEDTISDNEEGLFQVGSSGSLAGESIGKKFITVASLPHRRARAVRRLLQTKAYAELVEERILELEQKVRDLSNDKDAPNRT
jgi:hypothetical protein